MYDIEIVFEIGRSGSNSKLPQNCKRKFEIGPRWFLFHFLAFLKEAFVDRKRRSSHIFCSRMSFYFFNSYWSPWANGFLR
ncbi:hypothetical protein DLM75_01300 [Leptospira stimsonii]|uniref:Uncharacterized protein n=1 Tax=Leptospira stimsonii TaxID=2202203 RepID=A0A396ZBI6_9LEPT|nr:hypothetical protein DLM75_01300 [Leptospira stimsonii]